MALFVEVCKAMSFRRAAESLDMPSSTLSRRISRLEKGIGLRLFHRTTRKVELTEAGKIYFERCKRIVNEANLAHEHLGEMLAQPSGLLRVSMPVDFATIFLAPLITEFAEKYPGISFEFDLTPRKVDLISENVDLAIRMGNPPDSSLIARKLTQYQGKLFASAAYIKKNGVPIQPTDLADHECICFPKHTNWVLRRGDQRVEISVEGRFALNNIGMMRRLALLGQGIIFIPAQAIREDLDAKKLIPILPEWHGEELPVYILTETRLLPAKVQRFIDFLYEKMKL